MLQYLLPHHGSVRNRRNDFVWDGVHYADLSYQFEYSTFNSANRSRQREFHPRFCEPVPPAGHMGYLLVVTCPPLGRRCPKDGGGPALAQTAHSVTTPLTNINHHRNQNRNPYHWFLYLNKKPTSISYAISY